MKYSLLILIALSFGFLQSCKNKKPSVVKVFVRSASNELVSGAKVIIIGDINSNPATMEYVDTVVTNESGFEYDATSDTLSVPTVVASTGIQISAFTAGRLVLTTTNGALTTDGDATYDTTTDTLTVPNLVATTSFVVES